MTDKSWSLWAWVKPRTPKDVIDVLTLIVITLGLWFAYDQAVKIKESIDVNNKNISVTAWSNISTATLDVDKQLIENPKAQKYFYEGADIDKQNQDYDKVYAIAVMILDYFDYVAAFTNSYVGTLPNTLLEIDAWNNYFESTLKTSPLLCRIYLSNIDSYGSSIRKIAEPTCRFLQTKLPAGPAPRLPQP